MARQNDSRVNPVEFQQLVNRWMKPEYQAVCEQKRISRSKMEKPHVTRTKSFARLAEEEASIQVLANDSTNTQGIQEDDWKNDDLSKVMGPEKRGYIPDNFSPGQNNSTNGNPGSSGSSGADQNIGTPTNLS
ncbi:transposase, Ptta/En/Spm [Tanacetum coccineum]